MNIGVNFFGPKFKLYEDFSGTLARLKADGFRTAEICIAFFGGGEPPKELNLSLPPEVIAAMSGGIWPLESAAERLAAVRAAGLEVESAHIMLGFDTNAERLLAALPLMLEFGRANGIKCFVISPMKGLAAVREMTPALAELSDALAGAGITLLLHNHEVELLPEEGTTALDYVLDACPNLKLELDVGWAKFAGADPVALMKRYRDRLAIVHLKDIRADASPATRDTCFTAVGAGSIPLADIVAEAANCPLMPCGLVIDQDDSPNDIMDDLAAGLAAIRAAAR